MSVNSEINRTTVTNNKSAVNNYKMCNERNNCDACPDCTVYCTNITNRCDCCFCPICLTNAR